MNDMIGIKISPASISPTVISVIRKAYPISIAEIRDRAAKGECMIEYEYGDDRGLVQLIGLYKSLCDAGAHPQLFEDGEQSSLELFENDARMRRELAEEAGMDMEMYDREVNGLSWWGEPKNLE